MDEVIAHDFQNGFFLRDDFDIRKDAGMEPTQAYSLFKYNPFRRFAVFAGSLEWAIQESEKVMAELKDED